MNADLKVLVGLQKLDDTIRGLTAEIQSLPVKIAGIESQLSEHIAAVEAGQKRLAENQRSRRKRENDIAALREKISKHKDQMLEVKTNEQYRALLHEIEFQEGEIRKLEDQILNEMIESESLEKQLRQSQQDLAVERTRAQQEIRAAEEKKRQDEENLRAAEASREEARKLLAPDLYFSYERIAGFRKGTAVAEVHNGACGACHVCLRPQAYNEVRTNEQILNCESCGCILYYAPQPPAQ
jgi:predicted  nucleic acid-binding Zn-ribbon protein